MKTTAKKSKDVESKMLTETELELMTILWRLGGGTVNDVLAQLPKERELAYTSVSTILRILEQKGALVAQKEGRGHLYIPKLKKDQYEAKTVQHVVERVFDGTPVALVRQLLNSVDLKESDLQELRKLLDKAGDRK